MDSDMAANAATDEERRTVLKWAVDHAGGALNLSLRTEVPLQRLQRYLAAEPIPNDVYRRIVEYVAAARSGG